MKLLTHSLLVAHSSRFQLRCQQLDDYKTYIT